MITILKRRHPKLIGATEVVRSFSYKLQMEDIGGKRFESRDFFCSRKAVCDSEDADETSELLSEWCIDEVMETVKEYRKRVREQKAGRAA